MREAALAALAALIAHGGATAAASPTGPVAVVFLEPTTLEGSLSAPLSGVLARAGGVGLLTAPGDRDPVAAAHADLPAGVSASELPAILRAGPARALVVAVAPLTGEGGKDMALLFLARGDPQAILAARGPVHGLTSDTTRRPGLVSTADLLPTVLAFTGDPAPAGSAGSVIRASGPAPTGLLERYRTLQPLRLPAGATVLTLALLVLLAGVALLFRPASPRRWLRVAGDAALFTVALPAALLAAVMVPRPSALGVALIAVAGAVAVAWAARVLTRPQPAAAVALVAGVGMGLVIVDGLLGWPGMLMPLIGGNAFEGSRLYGLGNQHGGVLVAGAVLAASRLRPWAGAGLLFAVGLLAGLPNFGANFGVAVTLFAASGLWIALRVLGDPRWRGAVTGAGVAAAGVATVLVAHRFLAPVPTHVTRVVEGAERSGLGEIVRVYLHRLALNVEGLLSSPASWLVLLALPVWLVVAWRRWGPFGPALTSDPAWRDAAVVLAVASLVGFLANDTIGVAGMGLVYLSVALVYPALGVRWASR